VSVRVADPRARGDTRHTHTPTRDGAPDSAPALRSLDAERQQHAMNDGQHKPTHTRTTQHTHTQHILISSSTRHPSIASPLVSGSLHTAYRAYGHTAMLRDISMLIYAPAHTLTPPSRSILASMPSRPGPCVQVLVFRSLCSQRESAHRDSRGMPNIATRGDVYYRGVHPSMAASQNWLAQHG
jgi:hypothetical protein